MSLVGHPNNLVFLEYAWAERMPRNREAHGTAFAYCIVITKVSQPTLETVLHRANGQTKSQNKLPFTFRPPKPPYRFRKQS